VNIFSIGHSRNLAEHTIDQLLNKNVLFIVDVRSRPFSRFAPAYNRDTFQATATSSGIDYHWEGEALGGMTDLSVFSEKFQDAMARVLNLASKAPVVLMCSERNPADCHRAMKLTAWLHRNTDVKTGHILPDGVIDGREFEPKIASKLWHEFLEEA
jgi:uncharacterized protein (DUF488 family)